MTTDDDDPISDGPARDVIRMLGDALRQARAMRLWTREELVAHLRTPIPVNTYAGYEQGIRSCLVPRLVEICEALNITVMVNGAGVTMIPATQHEAPHVYFVAARRDGDDIAVTMRVSLADDPRTVSTRPTDLGVHIDQE